MADDDHLLLLLDFLDTTEIRNQRIVLERMHPGKCSKSVQSRAEVYVMKACDACTDMGQL